MARRLHGRKQEREHLLGLLDGARLGRGQVLIIEGGEGTGKSALLAEAMTEAARRDFSVASVGAGEGALAPLAPFLRALGGAPRVAANGHRPAGADDQRAWLMEQLWLVEQLPLLLTAYSERGPLLVALDDLQRADPATLLALRLLPPRLVPARLAWLVSRRPGEGGPALDQLISLLEHDGATRVVLDPLAEESVAEILTDVMGAPPGPGLLALAGEAGGIPALVVALAEGLLEEQGVQIDGGRAELVRTCLPGRLCSIVGERLAPLAPDTGHLLEMAALLDGPFPVEELARILERPPSDLLPGLDEALSAGILRAEGSCLNFSCGLGRRVVAEKVPEPVRQALRRQIGAGSTTGQDSRPSNGSRPTSPRYPLAKPPVEADGPVAEPLWARALVSWRQGRPGRALDRARQAVDQSGSTTMAASAASTGWADPPLTLAGMLADIGQFDEAKRILATLAEGVERTGDRRAAAALASVHSRLAFHTGDVDGAAAAAESGCIGASECGDELLLATARSVLAAVALRRGDLARARQDLEGQRARLGDPPSQFLADRFRLLEAQLACAGGSAAGAVELLAPIYEDPGAHRSLLVEEPAAAAWMVRTALKVDARARATAVARAAAELAADNPSVAPLLGGAAHARGVLDRDGSALLRAIWGYRRPWNQASAAEDAGVVLAAGGDRSAALAQFDQALAAYEKAGAVSDASRLRSRLRSLGVRRRHWRQVARPVYGWDSLTDTERSVAGQVAEGLTNRQVAGRMFLSPHTIDFHLRQIFRKLDISSRVELARHLVERDGAITFV